MEEGTGRINGDGHLTSGGEHTMQCIDQVLWSCAPETCTIVTQCYPNKFNKKGENESANTNVQALCQPE